MILYLINLLIVIIVAVDGQKESQGVKGSRYSGPIPYYNLASRPGSGVGVLQDLSNARILSNEPFIISFEFPKLGGGKSSLTDSMRKSRFGNKRTKPGRKKNRRPRHFPYVQEDGDPSDRTKRYRIIFPLQGKKKGSFNLSDGNGRRDRKFYLPPSRTSRLLDTSSVGQQLKPTNDETTSEAPIQDAVPDLRSNILQQVPSNSVADPQEAQGKTMQDVENRRKWQEIKDSWAALLEKRQEMGENDISEDDMDEKSRKMWANCQLLKLLKAPQRNPYFYRLLPPNYPAFIVDEEKQLQCNKLYDITDLARDKKRIAEKIDELERILSSNFGVTHQERKKRDVGDVENEKEDKKFTLQDESLQGKAEGETRSDRSKRTKAHAEEKVEKRNRRQRERGEARGKKEERASKTSKRRKSTRRGPSEAKKETPENTQTEEAKQVTPEMETDGNRKSREAEKKPLHANEVPRHKKPEDETVGHNKDEATPITQAELNRIVKQKELEANIFDKVVTAMKKYEDSNPYDESFPPKRQEDQSETKEEEKNGHTNIKRKVKDLDSSEDGFELEDAVKTLAKVFKMLSLRQDMKKKICAGCVDGTIPGDVSSDEVRASKNAVDKSTPRCSCPEDCPFCLNCLKCINDCTRNAMSSKDWKMTPIGAAPTSIHSTHNGSKKVENEVGSTKDASPQQTEASSNAIKRMYRSKLPPSRDLVRLYFDNPENKLLVWTKRGRRTMPWGPLESDLQLYRDRARQILKSAEDILQRIRETEEKIHPNEGDGHINPANGKKDEKVMDEIIKKVVNEDDTAKLLKTQWEDQVQDEYLEKSINKNDEPSRIIITEKEEESELPNRVESTYAPEHEDLDKEKLNAKEETEMSVQAPKDEVEEIADTIEAIRQRLDEEELESKSVEAAVVEDMKVIDKYVKGEKDDSSDADKLQKVHVSEEIESKETEINQENTGREDEDVEARVEAVNSVVEDVGKEKIKENAAESVEDTKSKEAASESVEDAEKDPSSTKDISMEVVKLEAVNSNESGEGKSVEVDSGSSEENLSAEEIIRQLKKAIQEEKMEQGEMYKDESEAMEGSNEKDVGNVNDEDKLEMEMNLSKAVEKDSSSAEKRKKDSEEDEEEDEDGGKSQVEAIKSEVISEEDSRSEGDEASLEVVKTEMTEKSASLPAKSEENTEMTSQIVGKEHAEEKTVFENQIKPIEDNYIIKGIKQSKEEKEAILKVLQEVDGSEEEASQSELEADSHLKEESTSKEASHETYNQDNGEEEVELKSPENDSFKKLVSHLGRGHMDEKDFEVVKKLDGSKIDLLVDEMQKNDEKGVTTSCKTRLKLCQAACACNGNNTGAQELDKYDIIKGFLSWLKEVEVDGMVPITV